MYQIIDTAATAVIIVKKAVNFSSLLFSAKMGGEKVMT
jgi:hypothetical protein